MARPKSPPNKKYVYQLRQEIREQVERIRNWRISIGPKSLDGQAYQWVNQLDQ